MCFRGRFLHACGHPDTDGRLTTKSGLQYVTLCPAARESGYACTGPDFVDYAFTMKGRCPACVRDEDMRWLGLPVVKRKGERKDRRD